VAWVLELPCPQITATGAHGRAAAARVFRELIQLRCRQGAEIEHRPKRYTSLGDPLPRADCRAAETFALIETTREIGQRG